jgi:hypothetical protein
MVTNRTLRGYGLGIFRDEWDIHRTLFCGGSMHPCMTIEDDASDVESSDSDTPTSMVPMESDLPSKKQKCEHNEETLDASTTAGQKYGVRPGQD